jgi:hypothetical protein
MRKRATAKPRRPKRSQLRRPMPANRLTPTQRRLIIFEKIGRYAETVAASVGHSRRGLLVRLGKGAAGGSSSSWSSDSSAPARGRSPPSLRPWTPDPPLLPEPRDRTRRRARPAHRPVPALELLTGWPCRSISAVAAAVDLRMAGQQAAPAALGWGRPFWRSPPWKGIQPGQTFLSAQSTLYTRIITLAGT